MTNIETAAPEPAAASPQRPYPHQLFASLVRPCIAPGTVAPGLLRTAFDIETNGLLDTVSKVHSLVITELDADKTHEYLPQEIEAGLAHLSRFNVIAGHNACGFDLRVLNKLYGWTPPPGCAVFDTLIVARLILPHVGDIDAEIKARTGASLEKLHGRFSLEAFGVRLGHPKVGTDIEDWSAWTPEMQARCVKDTLITKALWHLLKPEGASQAALELEHHVAAICERITADGAPFDVAAARRLHEEWTRRYAALEAQLQQQFPGTNLNSRAQIGALLESKGWVPEQRTSKTGQPSITDEILETIPALYPEFAGLAEYDLLRRRIAQLATGPKAWLKHISGDGRIHGGLVHIGTPHSRAKHLEPNLAQVPNPKKGGHFAAECRALFRADNDWVFVACDQSNLQDRGFAHYLSDFDGGAYAEAFLAGKDQHWESTVALGFVAQGTERDKDSNLHTAFREGAKRFRYAFLYGAGAEKAGRIIYDTARAVQQIEPSNGVQRQFFGETARPEQVMLKGVGAGARDKFLAATPGLRKLRDRLYAYSKRYSVLPGLDGRRVPVRAQYTALNFIVTSSEAIICKHWLAQTYDELCARFRYGWDGDVVICLWIHDEIVCCCRPEIADSVGEIMVRHAIEAGAHFNFKVPLSADYKVGRSWAGEAAVELTPKARTSDAATTAAAGREIPIPESVGGGSAVIDDDAPADEDADEGSAAEFGVDADNQLGDVSDELAAMLDGAGAEQQDGSAPWHEGEGSENNHGEETRSAHSAGAAHGNGHDRGADDHDRGHDRGADDNGYDRGADDNGYDRGHDRGDRGAGNYPHGERNTGREVGFYIYRDARGQPYLGIRRVVSATGRKQFPQFHWVGNGWKLGAPEGPKIPYRLPDLLAIPAGAAVYIPEGEKDADSVAELGLVATTNPEGATPIKAKISKWVPELNKWFSGMQRAYILADNDDVGAKFAREKARALEAIIPDIRIVQFPDVPNGEDVTYWLKSLGHTKQELLARCETAPQWQVELESARASEVKMRAIVWLWSNRFAIGKIGIVAGLPDEGKGQILCYIAARITRGLEWPNGEGRSPQGNVLILSAEEDPQDSLVPRLAAAGADLECIHFINMVRDHDEKTGQPRKRMFSLVSDLEKLRRKIVQVGNVVAVLIDPMSAYFGVGQVDSYRDTDVRAVLGPLKDLAEEMRCAIISIMHFNKKADITNALLRVSNSMAFVGLPRHVYSVVADVENMRKLFVRAKNNDAAEGDNQTMAYHFDVREVGFDVELGTPIRAPFIEWEPGYIDVTATEAMQAAGENKSPRERDKAKNLLLELLAGGTEVPVEDIKDTAGGHGLAWRTIRRAADDLKVIAYKDRETPKGKWFWKLPQEGNF
jgi:DNA polymerase I-like protein with 3'-5' exonuclease and polymerase domains